MGKTATEIKERPWRLIWQIPSNHDFLTPQRDDYLIFNNFLIINNFFFSIEKSLTRWWGGIWGLLSVFELLSANKIIIRSSNFFSFSSVQFGDLFVEANKKPGKVGHKLEVESRDGIVIVSFTYSLMSENHAYLRLLFFILKYIKIILFLF